MSAPPVDPNGLTITFAEGGFITIAPGPSGGVTFSMSAPSGFVPEVKTQNVTLAEAVTVQTLLNAIITNLTPPQ